MIERRGGWGERLGHKLKLRTGSRTGKEYKASPKMSPLSCKLLTAHIGHFDKATRVTRCILEVKVRTTPVH